MIEREYKELRCKDLRPNCDFTIQADTEEEVLKKCQDHACSVHNKCSDSPETRETIKSRIRDVWA